MTRKPRFRACALALALVTGIPVANATQPAGGATLAAPDAALQAAIGGSWRDPANVLRDPHRHPGQTLAFFGIRPDMTVVEITPGGGWYTEILAPYLQAQGRYIAAVVDPDALPSGPARDYPQRARDELQHKLAGSPAQYASAEVLSYDPQAPVLGPAGSADMVVTFRNVHNWRGGQSRAPGMFKAFYDVLRPGGVLGVVEHRAKAGVPEDDRSGYVGQAQVIALAEAAGFRLDASSEVNANPRDTKDHANGVWTLPPVNRHDPSDRAKYQAIGESDRMTLRFVKPAAGE